VRFGRSPVSHTRQHFKVAHRHALSNEEIPTKDRRNGKRQRVECAEADSQEGHDLVDVHDLFADSVEYGVDCNNIGDFNEDDTGYSQSTAEDCIDDKNLFNPLLIQNEMENQLTEWENIQNEMFDHYLDYIMCDLDPNSPPMEEDTPLDNDEDVADDADMLAIIAYEDADCYYSHDDFLFLDTREEQDKFLRKNSVRKSHCQNQLYFYQKYFQKAKSNCDNTGGYRGLVGRANVGNCENMHILVGEKEITSS
jgi:hypothetical protein